MQPGTTGEVNHMASNCPGRGRSVPTLDTLVLSRRSQRKLGRAWLLGALVCLGTFHSAARADDTEVFFGQNPTNSAGPNILFLIDTGNAMCSSSTGSATTSVTDSVSGTPVAAGSKKTGYTYTMQIAEPGSTTPPCQFGLGAVTSVTVTASGSTTPYSEATSLAGVSATTPYYANLTTGLVTFDSSLSKQNVVISYTYPMTRLEAVKNALMNVLTTMSGQGTNLNVGLMRLSVNGSGGAAAAKGGMIVQPVTPVTTANLSAFGNVLCMNLMNPTNCLMAYPNGSGSGVVAFDTPNDYPTPMGSASSPLTEMLFEAYDYFAGGG